MKHVYLDSSEFSKNICATFVLFFLSDVTSNLVQCIFFLEKNVSIQFDHSLYDIVGDAKTNARSKKHLFICFTNINTLCFRANLPSLRLSGVFLCMHLFRSLQLKLNKVSFLSKKKKVRDK